MNLECRIYASNETWHPTEDDRGAHQYEAQSNLRNDEAAGCTGANSSGALASLWGCKDIEFPGSANRHERRQYGCSRYENHKIDKDAPIRTEAQVKAGLTRRQEIQDHQRDAISEHDAESSSEANDEQAFHKQHASEPRPPHTERQANGDFAPARNRAREKKRGYIAAGKQKNERQRPQHQRRHPDCKRTNERGFDFRSVGEDQRGLAIERRSLPLH